MAEGQRGVEAERIHQVSETQLRGIERANKDADHATDTAYARILREHSGALRELLASTLDHAKYEPPAWLVAELTDELERECRWLDEVALKVAPVEGTS